MDLTITLTDEQAATLADLGVDAQAVCVRALADAVERAAVAAVDEQANALRAEALATVAETFPPAPPPPAEELED